MQMIQLSLEPAAVPHVLKAVAPFVTPENIQLFSSVEPPKPEGPDPGQLALAKQIADLLRPTGNQSMRLAALGAIFGGYDTFFDEHGEANPSMRNAIGAASKSLRPLFKYEDSPLERLVRRRKHYEPGTTNYLGTRYELTALGLLVRKVLMDEGVIFKGASKAPKPDCAKAPA